MIVAQAPEGVSIDVEKVMALGRTLIRSRSEAVILLSSVLVVGWGVLRLSGLLQFGAVWLAAELVYYAYSRWR